MLAVLICGLSGFSDFHKADWLQHILRLQDEEVGCFGRDSEYHKPAEIYVLSQKYQICQTSKI